VSGSIAGIVVGIILVLIVVGLFIVYLLNKLEIISIYIPHEYRKYCLKGYLTREEKEAIKNDATYLERLTWNKALVKCLSK